MFKYIGDMVVTKKNGFDIHIRSVWMNEDTFLEDRLLTAHITIYNKEDCDKGKKGFTRSSWTAKTPLKTELDSLNNIKEVEKPEIDMLSVNRVNFGEYVFTFYPNHIKIDATVLEKPIILEVN